MIQQQNPKVHLLIPFYNAERWLKTCLKSVISQEYKNITVWALNDASTDNSLNVLKLFSTIQIISTECNQGPLANILNGLDIISPNPEDIIAILDGDDYLSTPDAIDSIVAAYKKEDCVMTYGQFKTFPDPFEGYAFPLPNFVKKKALYRCVYPFIFTPVRSFLFHTFSVCSKEEFLLPNKNHTRFSSDQALMFPIAEKSNGSISFIPRPLYAYNRSSPINGDKIAPGEQQECSHMIRSLDSYLLSGTLDQPSRWSACTDSELETLLDLECMAMQKLDAIGNSFFNSRFTLQSSRIALELKKRSASNHANACNYLTKKYGVTV